MKKDNANKMIAGVCAGIAKSQGWDATLVRLGFIASFVFWGVGPIIYLILWVIMGNEDA